MKLKDAEGWAKHKAANTDAYGRAVIVFAERWADLMEPRIDAGEEITKEMMDETSREAVPPWITGFMYGCAVSILSQAWEHGEELRRCHNLATQLGNEGEKANESGGTLNPAVISFGKKEE